MNIYREKIYALTNRASKSRNLTSILVSAYKNDLRQAYEILVKIPNDPDRLKLLAYIEKPNLSHETIKKMVDIFCFYNITLKNNQKYKKIFQTNNFDLLERKEDRLLLAQFVNNIKAR